MHAPTPMGWLAWEGGRCGKDTEKKSSLGGEDPSLSL